MLLTSYVEMGEPRADSFDAVHCADLTLEVCVILEGDAANMQRIVAFLVVADHGIPRKAGQISVNAKAEAIPRPL